MPTLAEVYVRGIRLRAEPGTQFVYSNHGFATLGQIVEEVSGVRFDRYLRQHIFEPLGMSDTSLLRSEVPRSRLATAYTLGRHGPMAVIDREWVTAGALERLLDPARHGPIRRGAVRWRPERARLDLRPKTLRTMFAPLPARPGMPGMGLGFAFPPTVTW